MKTSRTLTRRMTLVAAPALAAVLLLGGCGISTPDEVISPTPGAAESAEEGPEELGAEPVDTPRPDSDAEALSGETTVSPEQAGGVATEEYPGSRVVSIELERNRGVTVWEVEVVTTDGKYEVEIDVETGAIVQDKPDHTSHLGKYLERLDAATLTYADAIDIIAGLHPGATLVELELDEEDGGLIWEAEVVTSDRAEYDVEIDARTGEVLLDENDD